MCDFLYFKIHTQTLCKQTGCCHIMGVAFSFVWFSSPTHLCFCCETDPGFILPRQGLSALPQLPVFSSGFSWVWATPRYPCTSVGSSQRAWVIWNELLAYLEAKEGMTGTLHIVRTCCSLSRKLQFWGLWAFGVAKDLKFALSLPFAVLY